MMETGAGFGYKIEWLAVRSLSAEAIQPGRAGDLSSLWLMG